MQLLGVTNTRHSGPVNHPTGDGVDNELDGQLAVIRIELSIKARTVDNDLNYLADNVSRSANFHSPS